MADMVKKAEEGITKEMERSKKLFEKHYHNSSQVKFHTADNYDVLTRLKPKEGRNKLCKCGSNKKYKKCCGKGE